MIPLKDNLSRRTFPFVNILLILINIGVFAYEIKSLAQPEMLKNFIHTFAVVPAHLLASPITEWHTVFSSMFLHGSWMHIAGNMLYLWIFGDNVEDRMGHMRYLVFYLLIGFIAAMTQICLFPQSQIPMLGASGAIAGVLGAYFVLFPKARVLALVPIWIFIKISEIPAFFFLGFWFIIQAFQSWGSIIQTPGNAGGGVAWWAHASGFLAGLLLIFFFRKPGKSNR